MVKLVLNNPPDFDRLGALLFDKDDLLLVWPEARFPFDREQWRERLSLHPRNRSYSWRSMARQSGTLLCWRPMKREHSRCHTCSSNRSTAVAGLASS
jgi:hypothetical protein